MQVDTVLAWLERPYIVIFIVVVLLQMVGEIFVGESPNPTIAFARELHLGVKPSTWPAWTIRLKPFGSQESRLESRLHLVSAKSWGTGLTAHVKPRRSP